MRLPIAITMGDAAGIGPEIIAMLYQREAALSKGTFVVGDVQILRRAAAVVARATGGIALPVVALHAGSQAWLCPSACIPVYQVGAPITRVPFGQVSAEAGEFSGRCVVWAANAALRHEVAAVVTAPIHKASLHAAGQPYDQYPGHTEMLQATAAAHLQTRLDQLPVRMMLANEALRVVLVSIHVPLRDAIAAVTVENVLQTILITHAALGKQLGRTARIAVAGLNPHAGEGGLFGSEELHCIAPAIQLARERGCQVQGPIAPDTVFMRARRVAPQSPSEFDVVIAMYHDQGLIPLKYLGLDSGVNITLGLPLLRTSPDHGTAFDIAGQGKADPSSLVAALRMAQSMLTS